MAFISYGFVAKVKVYESFVKGAREGWDTGVRIIPYVIAILVAEAMFRASGAMDAMTGSIGIFTSPMGMPPELIPQAMVRPLSGSGAGALMIENVHSYHPDSYIGYLSSVLNGSTETTFYVLAVYFGAVGVSKVRHAVLAGLSADIAGLVASVAICAALFGHLPLKIMEGDAQESAASAVQAPVSPPEDQESTNGLGMEKLQRAASLDIQLGQAIEYEGHRVQPISLQVLKTSESQSSFEPKKSVLSPAFLMAHGHYGEGKSSGEAQGPSHVLADRGRRLGVGYSRVEESDQPNRQIHFEEGAKNRDALLSANSSAMALQVHGLQAGLDYLSQREDIQWIGAGGASGGGVQAFYTALEDPRIQALVMASFVPIPRLEKEGGCPCDWVGSQADKAIVTTLGIPSLWMSETHPSAPFPLPENSRFRHIPGPHGFEKPMITEAVLFLDEQSGHSSPKALLDPIPHTPATALVSSNIGQASISDLLQAGR